MSCAQCEKQGCDHDALKKQCEESLFHFVKYFVSDWVDDNLHLPLTEYFQEGIDAGDHKYLMMIPRGHLKTTVFSIGFILWMIIRNPELRILFVMSSMELAIEKLDEIKVRAQGNDFRHFWGDLVPDIKSKDTTWTKKKLLFNRKGKFPEPTLTAKGATTRMTGSHYDIIILDDLIDGAAENSQIQMMSAMNFYQRTEGLWVTRSNKFLLVVGTFWPGGYYERIIEDKSYRKVVLGCYVDERYREFMASQGYDASAMKDGDPIFERETLESLDDASVMFGSHFVNQMENKPEDTSLKRFKREDFGFFKWGDAEQKSVMPESSENALFPLAMTYRQLTLDPGGGGDNSDESAIVVSAWTRGMAHAFVLDVWHDRVTTEKTIEKIFELAKKWNVNAVRVEAAAMQVTIEHWFKNEMIRRGEFYPLDPAKHKRRGKGERIDALQPYIASHQVSFRRDQQDIIDEAVNLIIVDGKIMGRKSPNMVDALAYHVDRWNANPQNVNTDGEIPFVEEPEVDHEFAVRYGLACASRAGRRLRI